MHHLHQRLWSLSIKPPSCVCIERGSSSVTGYSLSSGDLSLPKQSRKTCTSAYSCLPLRRPSIYSPPESPFDQSSPYQTTLTSSILQDAFSKFLCFWRDRTPCNGRSCLHISCCTRKAPVGTTQLAKILSSGSFNCSTRPHRPDTE